ncbi:MAG: glycosyltransferase family 4 protein [Oscillochloridaceae bacterium umkhey_bin13]
MTFLFLTPDLDPIGGAQTSGKLALAGLRAKQPTHMLAYGPGAVPLTTATETVVGSQVAALRAALMIHPAPHQILVWHLALLRLFPLLRAPRARVTLMLLGIEAWRQHDPLTRLLLRRVDHFLSISDYTWQRFLSFYPSLRARPHTTVYLGLDTPATLLHPPPPDPPAALILGRIARAEDYKGHRELIMAWPLVRRVVPTAQLWIAGDGDLRPELEQLAQAQGLPDAIHFFGRVSEAQKNDLLARCRCLAMPSRGEGFGLVYLEAMRLGRPCLVSTADAGREVVNPPEAGLAVDPADRSALATALIRLLSPGPQWHAWSAQARTRYETHFTAAHFQQRLLEALRER